jgi:1-deoxy-D-xylulose-5-phosphate synthase
MKPIVAIYSSFLQRGYDQAIHDVALQNLPVVFGLDRAGLVGSDGATHHGAYDISFLRCIPNFVLMAPADENECRQMLYTATTLPGPSAVRFPRGRGPGVPLAREFTGVPFGRAELRRQGNGGLALLAFGSMLVPALALAERLDATVVNMRFIKPLDREMLCEIARTHSAIITLEENAIAGGAGSACSELLDAEGFVVPRLQVGIPDRFIEHGSREDCLAEAGLDLAGIQTTIDRWCASMPALKLGRPGPRLAAAAPHGKASEHR